MMRHGEDDEVRSAAARAIGRILYELSQREGEEKVDSAWLQGTFNALIGMAETDDTVAKTRVLDAIPSTLMKRASSFDKFEKFQAILLDGIEADTDLYFGGSGILPDRTGKMFVLSLSAYHLDVEISANLRTILLSVPPWFYPAIQNRKSKIYRNLSLTERACIYSPSASARVVTVSFNLLNPSLVKYWNVGFLMKSSTDNPLNILAH